MTNLQNARSVVFDWYNNNAARATDVELSWLIEKVEAALDAAERRGPAASGPYRVGVADAATSIHYAGATFTHEIYGSTDPAEPIAVCETPEQAVRLVALLNAAEQRGREQAAQVADKWSQSGHDGERLSGLDVTMHVQALAAAIRALT